MSSAFLFLCRSVPDFVVATMAGTILNVPAACLGDSNPEHRRGELLLTGFDSDVTALDTHPQVLLCVYMA